MDNDVDLYKPSSLGNKTWQDVHTEWFRGFYEAGFQNARARLVDYAQFMVANGDAAKLTADKQAVITELISSPAKYCNNTFVL